MLRASNLMAESWVYYVTVTHEIEGEIADKGYTTTKTPIQVSTVSESAVLYKVNVSGQDYYQYVEEEKLEPIKVTGEILEKNGFKNFGNAYYTYKIDDGIWLEYYPHEHRLTMIYEGIDEWQNHSKVREITFRCQCYYVHELQSALKLCNAPIQIKL